MLDFLGASTYYADLADSPVSLGPDGNLIHEFMEIERIMLEQSQTIGSTNYSQGSYQPYVCRVAGKIGNMGINHECLDIASTKTMSVSSQNGVTGAWNVSYTSITGQLSANQFVHTNVMININGVSGTLPSDVMDKFGSNVTCTQGDGGKIMGDGVINSFDLYVLAAAQFLQGPYGSLRDTQFATVATVEGRPDTKDRCCIDNPECPAYGRLDWQKRVAYKDCFSYRNDENSYSSSVSGRRMQEGPFIATLSLPRHGLGPVSSSSIPVLPLQTAIPSTLFKTYASRPEVHENAAIVDFLSHHKPNRAQGIYSYDIQSRTTTHGWSEFKLYTPFNATHAQPLTTTTTLQTDGGSGSKDDSYSHATKDMHATIFEYSVTSAGTWYWINIPSIHIALELSLSSIGIHEGIAISNDRAPNYMESLIPYNPSNVNLRFIRHREFYSLDTSECAVVSSSRRSSNAMENGVIYVSQSTNSDSKLCGFDLLVWNPHSHVQALTSAGPVCVLSGSIGMDGAGGSMQRSTSCVTSLQSMPPPTPPPPTPPPPTPPSTTQVPPITHEPHFPPPTAPPGIAPSSSAVKTIVTIGTIGILAAIAAAPMCAYVFTMSTKPTISYDQLKVDNRAPFLSPNPTSKTTAKYDRPLIALKLLG